jgi:hypothetical protein
MGGVSVNFVSKRGGNRVSGNVFIELMDKRFERNQTLPDYMKSLGWVPAGVDRIWDYAASLGGPIWKDHLWYFGSASISDPQTRSSLNAISRPAFSGNYYFKINAQYKNTTAQFSYNWSGSDSAITPISNYSPATQKNVSPSNFYTAELQHVMGGLLLTGKMTYSKTAYSLHAADVGWTGGADYNSGRHIRFPMRAWTYNYLQSAPKSALPPISMMLAQDEVGRRPYIVAYADYFAEKFLGGDHEFKVGIDFANNKMNREQLLPNQLSIYVNGKDTAFTWPDGTKPGVYKWFYFRDDIVGQRYTKRQSVFFQDTATYNRLTVNLGIRYDRNSWGWADVYMGKMLPWNPGASNGAWDPWCTDLTVKAGVVPKKPSAISPRLSLTYDLTGDGKNVLKASVARYTGALNNQLNETIAPGSGRLIYTPFFDFNNNNWPDEGEFNRYTIGQIDAIRTAKTDPNWSYYNYVGLSALNYPSAAASTNVYDPDWKTPVVEEIVLGYDKQLTQDISVAVNGYLKREKFNTVVLRYEGTPASPKPQWPWEVTWSKVGTDPVTGNDVYTANGRPSTYGNYITYDHNNYTKYYGLEFQFHKRLSHNWMGNFSFNYQDYKKHLNQPEYNPSQWYYFNDGASDPASYRSGLIYFNARWMIKANGLYKLPLGFSVSGTVVANEGNPVYDGRNTISGVTLYPKDAKYGDLRMPNVVQVNLGLEKEFILSEGMSVTLAALYYNVFNNTTVIRVGQQMVPQIMRPDMVTAPGIMQLAIRVNWR